MSLRGALDELGILGGLELEMERRRRRRESRGGKMGCTEREGEKSF